MKCRFMQITEIRSHDPKIKLCPIVTNLNLENSSGVVNLLLNLYFSKIYQSGRGSIKKPWKNPH